MVRGGVAGSRGGWNGGGCGAWCELEALRPTLRAFLGRRCRDENDVEDVIQETFLRAARYRASLTDPERLRAWTMRIAANVLSDCIRRDWRLKRAAATDEVLEAVEAAQEPAEERADDALFRLGPWYVDKEAALGHLGQVLAGLRDEDRRVLRSYYDGAQSCRRTAAECGIPANLVKVRLFRARERVRLALRRRLALDAPPGLARRGA